MGATIKVALEIEQGAEPLRGSVDRGGEVRAFVGWLGLITALEDAMEASSGGAPVQETPTDGGATT